MSDQDFFFDEDEKPADKPAPKGAESKGTSAKPAAKPSAKASAASSADNQMVAPAGSVTMMVFALGLVVALLLGVIVGILLPVSVGGGGSAVPASTVDPSLTNAPQLTQQQLNSGQLPAGHPSIGATKTGK